MKIIFTIIIVSIAIASKAQVLQMTDETSEVHFSAGYLAGRLDGKFKGVNGTAVMDTVNMQNSKLELSFKPATVTTSENYLTPDLNRKACFDAAAYPIVQLTSSSITKLQQPGHYLFKGQLTVKGKSKDISFPLIATPNAGGYDFSFMFELRRKHFNLKCGSLGKRLEIEVKAYGKRMQ